MDIPASLFPCCLDPINGRRAAAAAIAEVGLDWGLSHGSAMTRRPVLVVTYVSYLTFVSYANCPRCRDTPWCLAVVGPCSEDVLREFQRCGPRLGRAERALLRASESLLRGFDSGVDFLWCGPTTEQSVPILMSLLVAFRPAEGMAWFRLF